MREKIRKCLLHFGKDRVNIYFIERTPSTRVGEKLTKRVARAWGNIGWEGANRLPAEWDGAVAIFVPLCRLYSNKRLTLLTLNKLCIVWKGFLKLFYDVHRSFIRTWDMRLFCLKHFDVFGLWPTSREKRSIEPLH